MEKKVPSTLCLLSLSPPPEIRFTQTKSHLLVHSKIHPTMFHALILLSLNVQKIKTRKLLGDYSSENSECNRSELRTLEIHFLESV